jgi:hypothetical protein
MKKITTIILSLTVTCNAFCQDINLNLPESKDSESVLLKNRDLLTIISCTGFVTSSMLMKKNPNMMYVSGGFLLCTMTLQIPEIKKKHAKLHRRKK